MIMYVDGASRGNPGPSSIGVSLQDPDGQEIDSISQMIGDATNNVAEYTALVEGLKLALQKKIKEIEIRADSELMVRQINGEYKIKAAQLKPLFQEAKLLTMKFKSFKMMHIPREENTRADELANLALDQ